MQLGPCGRLAGHVWRQSGVQSTDYVPEARIAPE
jgi:hypothetical protein